VSKALKNIQYLYKCVNIRDNMDTELCWAGCPQRTCNFQPEHFHVQETPTSWAKKVEKCSILSFRTACVQSN